MPAQNPYQYSENQPPIGPADMTREEFQELAVLVAEAVGNGDDREEIIGDLTNSGWEYEEADGFVGSIERHVYAPQESHASPHSGGGDYGWLIWIGALVLINIVSRVLGWDITIF